MDKKFSFWSFLYLFGQQFIKYFMQIMSNSLVICLVHDIFSQNAVPCQHIDEDLNEISLSFQIFQVREKVECSFLTSAIEKTIDSRKIQFFTEMF